ncbi:phosphatase PAP2 family protein [Metabacillus herbersteinensis]|uniref:Phosphatase PAP2 family protein n=1 Tax=Metabacillus herbersteinensis TaxID=283816 RepID=A0ABV6GED5_9BACI
MINLLFVFILAVIGISRLVEGAHYSTDVIGGFMCGIILLFGMQFLYEFINEKWLERSSKRNVSL